MDIQDFSELIKHAGSILGLSDVNIEDKYASYPVCITEHIEKGVREDILEIRFEAQKATLSVTFDNDNICSSVFLFADKVEDIGQVLLYLSEQYYYDFLNSHWLLSNCYMKVKGWKEDVIFIFFTKQLLPLRINKKLQNECLMSKFNTIN